MLRTPLKNSKNVNKPFKSPFNSSTTPNAVKKKVNLKNINTEISSPGPSTSSTRVLEAKRILSLDDDGHKCKKRKLEVKNEENISKVTVDSHLNDGEKKNEINSSDNEEEISKVTFNSDEEENKNDENNSSENEEEILKELPDNLTKSDLLALKKKVFEMRQELDLLKSREQLVKKHDPKELRASIDKWRSTCQTALETLSSKTSERNGKTTTISDVLKMLNISEEVVHYSEKDDSFY